MPDEIPAPGPGPGHPRPRLPRVLVASDGRSVPDLPPHLADALVLRDLDISTLAVAALAARPPLGVELDSVDGLNADEAGVRFLLEDLGIRVVLTRRPTAAARVAAAGGLALLHVFAFDSTGLGRSLDAHPRIDGVATAVSPGPVLAHLTPADLARLPRPVVGYGLIETPALARMLLDCVDAVLVRADCARALAL